MKTIQINLGGMKAAELRGSRIKKPKVQQRPGLYFFYPSTVRYSHEEENQQSVNAPQPLTF
jgi:hypothetical protein